MSRLRTERPPVVLFSPLQHSSIMQILSRMVCESDFPIRVFMTHQDWMSSTSWDLALTADRAATGRSDVYNLQRLNLMCTTAADHPLAKKTCLFLRDLEKTPLLLPVLSSPERNDLEILFHRSGFTPRVAMESDNYESYGDLLQGKDWAALTFECSIPGLTDPQLIRIPMQDDTKGISRYIRLICNPRKKMSPEAGAAKNWLVRFFQDINPLSGSDYHDR